MCRANTCSHTSQTHTHTLLARRLTPISLSLTFRQAARALVEQGFLRTDVYETLNRLRKSGVKEEKLKAAALLSLKAAREVRARSQPHTHTHAHTQIPTFPATLALLFCFHITSSFTYTPLPLLRSS